MTRFGPVMTAMVTPFHHDGSVDLDGCAALAAWLVDHGNDALVVTGTTGEASTLTDEEQVEVWRAVRGAVAVPVIAGSGTNDTRHASTLTAKADAVGLDGVLLVTPYYNRPPQTGIEAHFRALAAATDLPVVLYDVPARTGRSMSQEVLLRLAHDVDNVVGFKDARGDVGATARLVADAPEGFEVYCGDDDLTLPMLAVGAVGLISVAAHWAAGAFVDLFAAYAAGDVARATELNARLLDSFDYETGDLAPNPLPAKAMLRVLGQPAGPCRLPLGDPPSELDDRARAVLAGLAELASV